jgi:hypothetical protein
MLSTATDLDKRSSRSRHARRGDALRIAANAVMAGCSPNIFRS